MVKYFTDLSLEYPFLFIIIEMLIVVYLVLFCKRNYKEFTINDLGISQSFISSCAFLAALLLNIVYLLLTVLNGQND